MKRLALIMAFLIIAAGLAGCGSKPGAASPATTGTLETMPAVTQPPDEPDEPADIDEPDIPEQTPWPEPASIGYQGQYMAVAQDADDSKYPALDVTQEVQILLGDTGATLKIPSSWKMEDQGIPTLVDAKGRSVGQIYLKNAYLHEPYFSLMPEGGIPMLWEAPASGKYQYDARALTLESDTTSAAENKKTIMKVVCLLGDEAYTDDDGLEYYLAFCLSFDKAYVDGDGVDYVVSDKTIDEIAQSFAEIDLFE